jgi:hypothetical protein
MDRSHYDRCLAKGTSPKLAEILASGSAPGTNRADERWRLMRDPESKARGLKGLGKYQPSLARFPGDPQAVVHSRAHAKAVADKNGWKITDRPINSESSNQQRRKERRRVS